MTSFFRAAPPGTPRFRFPVSGSRVPGVGSIDEALLFTLLPVLLVSFAARNHRWTSYIRHLPMKTRLLRYLLLVGGVYAWKAAALDGDAPQAQEEQQVRGTNKILCFSVSPPAVLSAMIYTIYDILLLYCCTPVQQHRSTAVPAHHMTTPPPFCFGFRYGDDLFFRSTFSYVATVNLGACFVVRTSMLHHR